MILGMFATSRRVLVSVVVLGAVLAPAMPAQASSPAPTPIGRGDLRPLRPKLPPGPSTLASYTLLAPVSVSPSQLVARAVLKPGTNCPALATTKKVGTQTISRNYPMLERTVGPKARTAFATVKVCSAAIPAGITSASVGGRTVPAAIPANVNRIGIMADTGCRVEPGRIQDCAKAWPLAQISARLAAQKPQVILDPGDYYYRESACPTTDWAKCGANPPVTPVAGMPFKDSSNGWMTDAIKPMSTMFPVAPIAFLRGNHEACDRAGNGFFLFLDPRPTTASTCEPVAVGAHPVPASPAVTDTWAFAFSVAPGRRLKVAMVDSAYGTDDKVTNWVPTQNKAYKQAAAVTTKQAGWESWLMTHRPIFGRQAGNGFAPNFTPWVSNDQAAASRNLLGNYQMILSSHIHLMQAVQIKGQPPNLVVGNGGTMLDANTTYPIPNFGPLAKNTGQPIDPQYPPYPKASSIWTKVAFGFGIATAAASKNSWNFSMQGPGGNVFGTCALVNPTGTAPNLGCK